MKFRSAIGQIFALVAIAGLVLAPIARPAMAMDMPASMDHAMASDRGAADAADGMSSNDMFSDDMPCCPGKPSLPDCGKDCPLMALCGTVPVYFASQTGLTIPITIVSIVFPGDQLDLTSVAYAPPRRPPKA